MNYYFITYTIEFYNPASIERSVKYDRKDFVKALTFQSACDKIRSNNERQHVSVYGFFDTTIGNEI